MNMKSVMILFNFNLNQVLTDLDEMFFKIKVTCNLAYYKNHFDSILIFFMIHFRFI